MLVFQPLRSLKISWLQKYVGEQYLSNAESETSKLSSYMTHDLNFSFVATDKIQVPLKKLPKGLYELTLSGTYKGQTFESKHQLQW